MSWPLLVFFALSPLGFSLSKRINTFWTSIKCIQYKYNVIAIWPHCWCVCLQWRREKGREFKCRWNTIKNQLYNDVNFYFHWSHLKKDKNEWKKKFIDLHEFHYDFVLPVSENARHKRKQPFPFRFVTITTKTCCYDFPFIHPLDIREIYGGIMC